MGVFGRLIQTNMMVMMTHLAAASPDPTPTTQRCDIATGRCKSDMFDFLVDVLPERLRKIKSKVRLCTPLTPDPSQTQHHHHTP